MEGPRVVMSYADLLKWTESDGASNKIEVFQLPHDPALQERYALVVAGVNAGEIINMIVDALDRHFSKPVAAQQESQEAHGPESRAQSSE